MSSKKIQVKDIKPGMVLFTSDDSRPKCESFGHSVTDYEGPLNVLNAFSLIIDSGGVVFPMYGPPIKERVSIMIVTCDEEEEPLILDYKGWVNIYFKDGGIGHDGAVLDF